MINIYAHFYYKFTNILGNKKLRIVIYSFWFFKKYLIFSMCMDSLLHVLRSFKKTVILYEF